MSEQELTIEEKIKADAARVQKKERKPRTKKEKKEKEPKLSIEQIKSECAASVNAYFDRIGPLKADLMPDKKHITIDISKLDDANDDIKEVDEEEYNDE